MNFIDFGDLNGWQRIGIVISVLWAVSIALFVAWENDFDFDHAGDLSYGRIVAAAFVPVLAGWLLVYAAIGAVRWIAAGFRR